MAEIDKQQEGVAVMTIDFNRIFKDDLNFKAFAEHAFNYKSVT